MWVSRWGEGENFFPSLPLNHLLSTRSCADTVQWPGTGLSQVPSSVFVAFIPRFCQRLPNFYLLQDCSLSPSLFFQPPVRYLHVGAPQTQPNLSYSPNSCGAQGTLISAPQCIQSCGPRSNVRDPQG